MQKHLRPERNSRASRANVPREQLKPERNEVHDRATMSPHRAHQCESRAREWNAPVKGWASIELQLIDRLRERALQRTSWGGGEITGRCGGELWRAGLEPGCGMAWALNGSWAAKGRSRLVGLHASPWPCVSAFAFRRVSARG